jgi:hypothetical protein
MTSIDQMDNINISYASDVLEEFQRIEAPLYRKVWAYMWNDGSLYNRMRKPYRTYAFDEARGEFYIPLGPNPYYNLNLHGVGIRVLDRMTQEAADEAVRDLREPRVSPPGNVRTRTLVLVAPRGSKPIVRGGYLERGVFLIAVVDRDPRRAVARVWDLLLRHLKGVLRGLVRSLGLEDWMLEEYYRNRDTSLLIELIKKYSSHIQRMFESLSRTIDFVKERLGRLRSRIEAQEVLRSIVRPLYRTARTVAELVGRLPEASRPSWSDTAVRLAEEIRLEMLLQV